MKRLLQQIIFVHVLFVLSIWNSRASLHEAILASDKVHQGSESHGSTIIEANDGSLIVVWYKGADEQSSRLYISRNDGSGWTNAEMMANDGSTCRNPVLFQPSEGPMLLYYHVGDPISSWKCYIKTSNDDGKTWSSGNQLSGGFLGPIRNKPVELPNGDLLCGSSTEGSPNPWHVHMEIAPKGEYTSGNGWTKTENLPVVPVWWEPSNRYETPGLGFIQPTILVHPNNIYQIFTRHGGACRDELRRSYESWSYDGGRTWDSLRIHPAEKDTIYTPGAIDGVSLDDGSFAMIYNKNVEHRWHLALAMSPNGIDWEYQFDIVDQEVWDFNPGGYPAIIQGSDGLLHVSYTGEDRSHIGYVAIDPAKLPFAQSTRTKHTGIQFRRLPLNEQVLDSKIFSIKGELLGRNIKSIPITNTGVLFIQKNGIKKVLKVH